MRKTTTILILAVALMIAAAACKDKKQVMQRPDNLINRITLVNILAESYLIESSLHVAAPDSIGKDELARQYYKDLFDRYKITNEQFESSIAYYISEEKSAEKLLNDASAIIINKRNELSLSEMDKPIP